MLHADLEKRAFYFNVAQATKCSNESLNCLKGVVPRKTQVGCGHVYPSILWAWKIS